MQENDFPCFFALAQKICHSPKGDFLLKGIYKKCNMNSAARPVSEKNEIMSICFLQVSLLFISSALFPTMMRMNLRSIVFIFVSSCHDLQNKCQLDVLRAIILNPVQGSNDKICLGIKVLGRNSTQTLLFYILFVLVSKSSYFVWCVKSSSHKCVKRSKSNFLCALLPN